MNLITPASLRTAGIFLRIAAAWLRIAAKNPADTSAVAGAAYAVEQAQAALAERAAS